MDRADSLWYHMPLATRFAHGSHFGAVDYFDPIFFASFYPANSEVVHATGILAFDRDILSPLLNLGWLTLGLTSAYAIGRPYGVGPTSLIGGAIALGAQNLVEFQAGEALNDIVGVVDVLACVGDRCVNALARCGLSPTGGYNPHRSRSRALPPASPPAPSSRSSPPSLPCSLASRHRSRGARLRAALWFGHPRLPRRRLLVRPQPDQHRQPAAIHGVRAASPADARSRLRASPRLLRLSLRDRLRRLAGLVRPRPAPLVRAAVATGPRRLHRWRGLRDLARR